MLAGQSYQNMDGNIRDALYVKFHAIAADLSMQISPMKRPVTFPPELVVTFASSLVGT